MSRWAGALPLLLLVARGWGACLEQEPLEEALRWRNASGLLRRRLPQSLIIGVRKGGTRALLEMLALHPHVAAARAEVHFFNVEENYRRGLSWYRRHMPLSRPGQLTVEKTPAYFSSPPAPARIRAMNPAVRLLLVVRDPVERLVSDYTQILHKRRARGKPYPSLERLLLPEGRELDPHPKALQRSLYAPHLARWLAAFPRRQLHVVDGGGLVREPLAELRRVERFLGLAPRLGPAHFYFNHTKGFYCLRPGPGGRGRCLDESKGRPHPPLPSPLVKQLCAYFRAPNQSFFRLAGRSFDWC